MTGDSQLLPPSPGLEAYLPGFNSRHDFDDIAAWLERARDLRVLVVGEAIIDEYQYVETMGKSGKEPVLAARYLSAEKFAGGSLAVANHVAAIAGRVDLVTVLGELDSQEQFIRASLDPAVEPTFLYDAGASTIVKRRFVEHYPLQKLFELYLMSGPDGEPHEALTAALAEHAKAADLVVVADYGHGMLGDAEVAALCDGASFLAVNAQTNADNRGFNSVSKYPRADFVSVSEFELRLELRNRARKVGDLVREVAERLSCPRFLVTRGSKGVLAYGADEGTFEIPGFTGRVVDRIGAGDAVLAVTALCAALGAPMEIVGMIGNAVGAQAVGTVGNSSSVDPAAVLAQLEGALAHSA